mmetsp:Transcript_8378/g.12914  ORF Transcript_8378/g.12914 Transcript_8378/m.12914 type:complete len:161 (+) Transcript_8378:135-617(+)|eukprot:CAMPEP_0178921156 /NCGR_PEP_ID=MMETSP0786-20121207/15403_1 /TAXON_ID=186022 /ORGANISM="Thalassionema frauenfeldii, Strain CCMP 1798" /LENGTH=160 /DNA_ID=CAMNT_0020595301 /DNA_START=47 /DNA_END=529 /DNA_ORIENTATION=+
MPPYTNDSELNLLDAEWDTMCDVVFPAEEVTSVSSSKAVCKVLEEWTSDEPDCMDLMDVDEHTDSGLLCDDLFCTDKAKQIKDSALFQQSEEKLKTDNNVIYDKLAESMRRSQESRVALSMKTCKATDGYERRQSVNEVLTSIQQSVRQIQQHFGPAASA